MRNCGILRQIFSKLKISILIKRNDEIFKIDDHSIQFVFLHDIENFNRLN